VYSRLRSPSFIKLLFDVHHQLFILKRGMYAVIEFSISLVGYKQFLHILPLRMSPVSDLETRKYPMMLLEKQIIFFVLITNHINRHTSYMFDYFHVCCRLLRSTKKHGDWRKLITPFRPFICCTINDKIDIDFNNTL
jgi:hypothetical protein